MKIALYSICAFAFIHAILTQLDIESNLLILVLQGTVSVAIGFFIKEELREIFEDFDWEPKNNIERIQNVFFKLTGYGVLSYFVQLSVMVLFIPEFEYLTLGNFKLYHILFGGISVIIGLEQALRGDKREKDLSRIHTR